MKLGCPFSQRNHYSIFIFFFKIEIAEEKSKQLQMESMVDEFCHCQMKYFSISVSGLFIRDKVLHFISK